MRARRSASKMLKVRFLVGVNPLCEAEVYLIIEFLRAVAQSIMVALLLTRFSEIGLTSLAVRLQLISSALGFLGGYTTTAL